MSLTIHYGENSHDEITIDRPEDYNHELLIDWLIEKGYLQQYQTDNLIIQEDNSGNIDIYVSQHNNANSYVSLGSNTSVNEEALREASLQAADSFQPRRQQRNNNKQYNDPQQPPMMEELPGLPSEGERPRTYSNTTSPNDPNTQSGGRKKNKRRSQKKLNKRKRKTIRGRK